MAPHPVRVLQNPVKIAFPHVLKAARYRVIVRLKHTYRRTGVGGAYHEPGADLGGAFQHGAVGGGPANVAELRQGIERVHACGERLQEGFFQHCLPQNRGVVFNVGDYPGLIRVGIEPEPELLGNNCPRRPVGERLFIGDACHERGGEPLIQQGLGVVYAHIAQGRFVAEGLLAQLGVFRLHRYPLQPGADHLPQVNVCGE